MVELLPSTSLEKRIALQQKVLRVYTETTLSKKPYSLALYMGTGIGKTKTAIDCARWYHDHIRQGDMLIVCHAEIGRDNIWPLELRKWAKDHPVEDAQRLCYQSLPKIKGRHFTVIILDEAHYLTARSAKFFEQNTVESLIVLTATPPRDYDKRQRLDELTGGNRFEYTADQAIADGILNDYDVHVFRVKLNETDAYCTLPWKPGLYTEREAYLQYCIWLTECQQRHISERDAYVAIMRFLGNTKTKTAAAQFLGNNLRQRFRRFIIFCAGIEQTAQVSHHTYHSQTGSEDYKRFQAMEIHELASVKQIQEGANIPMLDRAIVVQLDTNPLNTIQKIGRLLRLEVGSKSALFILSLEGTFDESWVQKALKHTPKHKVFYHNLVET